MNIQPLYDKIIIKAIHSAETTDSGIIVREVKKPNSGKVLAIGHGKEQKDGTLRPLKVQVGDIVMYPVGAGMKITVEKEDYLVMTEVDVIGIIMN
jgi:chaperonin GroES